MRNPSYYFAKNKYGTINCFTEEENPRLNEDSGVWEAGSQVFYIFDPRTLVPDEIWDKVREFMKDIHYKDSLYEIRYSVKKNSKYEVELNSITFNKKNL